MPIIQFFQDPNFVVMAFDCPYCNNNSTASVHEDGAACCDACLSPVEAPMSYDDAKALS
ncbi:hypothetical protein [uncultured Photobacterium sp.]|uniref:hypothetical protein n=1 Tax=uncultured Photobacterium sp. TaxID=173973 RepID=UPI002607F097|nr:hypothetical protein [uncultured Photobacterium sp.]